MQWDRSQAVGLAIAALGMAALAPQISRAAVVSFDFEGRIAFSQDPSNLLSGGFKSGDLFSGQVIYDTSKAQTNFAPGVYYFLEGGRITFASGDHTFVGSTASSTQSCWPSAMNCIEPFNVAVSDNGLADGDRLSYSAAYLSYDGQAAPGSPTRAMLQLLLTDSSKTALSSNALPTAPPDLSAFDRHRVSLFAYGQDFMAPPLYQIDAEVTSISATPTVPEPGTLALLLAGWGGLVCVGVRCRSSGISAHQ